jgi:hypothetical protein
MHHLRLPKDEAGSAAFGGVLARTLRPHIAIEEGACGFTARGVSEKLQSLKYFVTYS